MSKQWENTLQLPLVQVHRKSAQRPCGRAEAVCSRRVQTIRKMYVRLSSEGRRKNCSLSAYISCARSQRKQPPKSCADARTPLAESLRAMCDSLDVTSKAGPCYFAYVMTISQPSSHTSPGGLRRYRKQLSAQKISTTKK